MAQGPSVAEREQLLRLITGYRLTQALYVVAKLGLANLLVAGSKSAEQLAKETSVDPDRLHRVLRALAAHGVFAVDGDGRFQLNPLGELLQTNAPGSMAAMTILQGEEPYRAFGDLLHTVTTGETAFDHLFGMGHFDYLAGHPSAGSTFHTAMSQSRRPAGKPLEGYDFRNCRVIVDVGGGVGALLASVLQEHAHLRGILFDLPSVMDDAKKYLDASGVADRCELRAGSAFDAIPSGGDVYVMSRVLHDWPDPKALVLLRNCREVIPRSGTLLLKESVVPEDSRSPEIFDRDLMMMVMNGGRERTEGEWRALLNRGGFSLSRYPLLVSNPDLLEARPS